jgi:hypothetical protein
MTFKRLMCAFRGHEAYLHFGTNKISLQCVACGYESAGWTIDRRSSISHRLPALARNAKADPSSLHRDSVTGTPNALVRKLHAA